MLPVFLLFLTTALFQDPPSGTLILNGGDRIARLATIRAEVRLVSSGAGELQMSLSVDDTIPAAWSPVREISVLELPFGDGEKKVVLRLRDRLGKESPPVEAIIRLDTTPPVARVNAPERVGGSDVRVVFDVSDAVEVQHTEDPKTWLAWESYSTPKTIALSKGAGPKAVFFRFRDEAGNESVPGRVVVEAQSPSPLPPLARGIRSLAVGVQKISPSALELTGWLDGIGLKEMRVELDGVELLSRRAFAASWIQEIEPRVGPRRLVLTAWDAGEGTHQAQTVFLDSEASAQREDGEETRRPRLPLRAGVMTGILPRGVAFDSLTPEGNRRIRRGAMAVVRIQASATLVEPLYLQAAFEWAEGEDARILSGGADLGVRFPIARWGDVDIELGLEAGVYYSRLTVQESDFGDFQGAPLVRAGGTIAARLTNNLSSELMIDYRFSNYRYDEPRVAGNRDAKGSGVEVLLGLSWRF